jgi:hypothetical protein
MTYASLVLGSRILLLPHRVNLCGIFSGAYETPYLATLLESATYNQHD